MLEITFYGVRGSTPCSGPSVQEVGGNTSCVLVRVGDEPPIICDLGTGLRELGNRLLADGDRPFVGTALLSHLHWDHVQGVPFFRPVLEAGSRLDVFGPRQEGQALTDIVRQFIAPPLFPVGIDQLAGEFSFSEVKSSSFAIGSATVSAFDVQHCGPTNGYRIDGGGGSVAYISDCQQPLDGSNTVADAVAEACQGVDVLIHDAQYSAEELAERADWGHCTADYAFEVARAVEASRLVLYHHDPTHDDRWIAAQVERLRERAEQETGGDIEVLAACEGITLTSGPQVAETIPSGHVDPSERRP